MDGAGVRVHVVGATAVAVFWSLPGSRQSTLDYIYCARMESASAWQLGNFPTHQDKEILQHLHTGRKRLIAIT